jgi:hypothetical protein
MNSAMKFLLPILLIAAVSMLPACRRDDAGPAATPAAHQEPATEPPPTNRVDIPPMVRSNLGITFAKVERRQVAGTVRVPGIFELEPRARREYRMVLPGRVELTVDQYEPVAAGDLLYRFRSPAWTELQQGIVEAEQAIASAEAEGVLTRARRDESQSRLSLLRQRIDSLAAAEFRRADLEAEVAALESGLPRLEAEVQLATTLIANARGTRDHALRRASAAIGVPLDALTEEVEREGRTAPAYLTIDWIDVYAADEGIVEMLAVSDGGFVEPPAVVMATVDPARVRFRATALQSDLTRLLGSAGAWSTPARIAPPQRPGTDPGEAASATMTLGLEAHADQRTITLLARPDETRPWMRPGVSAFLEIVADPNARPALAIPRSAIVQDGLTHIFFRRDPRDPNKAIRVEADMGANDGRWVAINSGLTLNDEVVLDGVYELKLAADRSGTSQRGGHFHADGTWHSDH